MKQNFSLLWKFFEPISFGLIGMEVRFEIIERDVALWGTLAMMVALLVSIKTTQDSSSLTDFIPGKDGFLDDDHKVEQPESERNALRCNLLDSKSNCPSEFVNKSNLKKCQTPNHF